MIIGGSRQRVYMAIAVHIDSVDRICTHCRICRCNDVLREGLRSIVLKPGNGALIIASSQHVHIAISIHIDGVDRPSTFFISDGVLREALCSVILKPGHSIASRPRIGITRQHVHIAISVYIDSVDRMGTFGRCRDGVLREAFCSIIFIPGHSTASSRQHVHIAISVQINSVDRGRTVFRCRNGVLREALRPIILIPGHGLIM